MPGYQNVMEILVEQMYSSIESTLDCCACPLCKADIIAYALNQLPPKYVAMRQRLFAAILAMVPKVLLPLSDN